MVLQLIATGLLAYGVSSSSLNVNNDNHYDSNDNHICESITPNYANTFTNRVTGLYNFRDEINFYDWFNDFDDDVYSFTINFDDENQLGLCPISYGNQKIEFLESLYIEVQGSPDFKIYLDFYSYDSSSNYSSYELYLDEIVSISDLDYPYLFFNYSNSLTLSFYDFAIFDLLFTHQDNQYIVSYSGYYNFLTNSSLRDGDKFSILGSIVYNNIICNALYFQRQGIFSNVYYVNYDVSTSKNVVSVDSFETFRGKPNLLLSGVKMHVDTYNELSTIGVFSYVRDTQYDDTDFHDLLFTIMDTPIYFFSRLFDFQFFGVNLYIALSGLITLAIVVIIIRKIW